MFLAGDLLVLSPKISMLEKMTWLEFATNVYHCGLYRNLRSEMVAPLAPIRPNRIGRRM